MAFIIVILVPEGKESINNFDSYYSGDKIYLFSDGYANQFGGEIGVKSKYSNCRKLLIESTDLEMDAQRDLLRTTSENWRGDLGQIDDICIMGIKL